MNIILDMIASLCVIAGSTGMGCFYIYQYQKTIEHAENVLHIFILFRQDMIYSHATLPEICRQVSTQVKEPYGTFLKETYKKMEEEKGKNVSLIWKEELEQLFLKIEISEMLKELMLSLMNAFNCMDKEVQIKKFDMGIEKIQREIENRKEKQENKNRIYFSIGIMSGLLCCVLLL